MTHFGNGVEQGLHCLLVLAAQDRERFVSVRDLAAFQGVSTSFAAKLFTKLRDAGIVEAGEGLRGGYRLNRSADQISLLDVVDAIEGSKPLFRCREVRRGCILYKENPPPWAVSGVCEIHQAMLDAEKAMRASLAGVTIQNLLEKTSRKIPAQAGERAGAWFEKRFSERGTGVEKE